MLVPRSKHDEAVKIAKQTAESFSMGSPTDPKTRLGPLVSKVQQERVRGFIKKGVEEGATLVTGGPEQPAELPKGFFVKPTVFANVKNDMTIAQQEIFGPVLCIIPYDTEEDAVKIATTLSTVSRAASGPRIRSAQNASHGGFALARSRSTAEASNPVAPFGGYKQSGNGREYGNGEWKSSSK